MLHWSSARCSGAHAAAHESPTAPSTYVDQVGSAGGGLERDATAAGPASCSSANIHMTPSVLLKVVLPQLLETSAYTALLHSIY